MASLIEMIENEKNVCAACGEKFDVHFNVDIWDMPKHCRKCIDVKDRRPSIVQNRMVIAQYANVEVLSLPPVRWQHVQHRQRANARWKLDWSAKHWGTIPPQYSPSCVREPWQGRVVVWAKNPIRRGDLVNARVMESTHKVRQSKQRFKSDQTDRLRDFFVKMAQAAGREAPATFVRRGWHHVQSGIGEEVIETRRYVVLEKVNYKTDEQYYLCSFWGRVDQEVLEAPEEEDMFKFELRGGPKWGRFMIVPEEASEWDTPLGDRIQDQMNEI